jgi:hypothetical protein
MVSIGGAWQFGKLEDKIIKRHPAIISLEPLEKLIGILDFIFADCVKTAEKFDLF